jgi:FMN-dependent NADH-azoreductase
LQLSGAHLAARSGVPAEDAAISSDAAGGAYQAGLSGADIVVIGTPMYNFSVPSQLKIWIDHIIVPGKSIGRDENGRPKSLLPSG